MIINLTITNNTHNKAILNWTTDDTATHTYNIYKRIYADSDGNLVTSLFDYIGTTTDNHFEDDIKDTNKPSTPEIIRNTQVTRGEIVMNLKTRDLGTIYAYFIEAPDAGVSSLDAFATSVAGIKGYRYYVKPIAADGSVTLWEDDSRMIFQEGDAIKVKDLEDGHYMFYGRAQDKDGNLSDMNSIDFYIRNKYLNIEETINQAPVGVRYNNRYRGPQESKKTDFMYMQIQNNINKLKNRIVDVKKYVEVTDSKGEISEYIESHAHKVRMVTLGYNYPNLSECSQGEVYVDDILIHEQRRGMGFVVLDKDFKEIKDVSYDIYGDPSLQDSLAYDINAIGDDCYVFMQMYDAVSTTGFTTTMINALKTLGITEISEAIGRITFQSITYKPKNTTAAPVLLEFRYDSTGATKSIINTFVGFDYKTVMNQIKFNETSMIERPMMHSREVLQAIEEIEEKLNYIREELDYENRNH